MTKVLSDSEDAYSEFKPLGKCVYWAFQAYNYRPTRYTTHASARAHPHAHKPVWKHAWLESKELNVRIWLRIIRRPYNYYVLICGLRWCSITMIFMRFIKSTVDNILIRSIPIARAYLLRAIHQEHVCSAQSPWSNDAWNYRVYINVYICI